jgi:stage II sporulation protein D
MQSVWPLVVAGTLLGLFSCSGVGRRVALPDARASLSSDVRVRAIDRGLPVIRMVDLEDYVRTTALAEFAPAEGDRALVERMLEVQAITSRTFAVAHRGRHAREGFDFCATTHCQIYEPNRLKTSRWAEVASTAITRTKNTVLWYDSRPAEAVFHADCGGHTAAAADVWGGPGRRYLVALRDDAIPHSTWKYSTSLAEARAALNKDPRTNIGARLEAIEVVERDASGRVSTVRLRGVRGERLIAGEDLRQVFAAAFGPRSLRSTLFEVRRSGPTITFSGRGYGHGVGLCQAGALARLKKGASPQAVLDHYFPGTRIGAI